MGRDDWVICGSKTFITNGYSADLIVVVAARPSLEEGRRHHTLGMEASRLGHPHTWAGSNEIMRELLGRDLGL